MIRAKGLIYANSLFDDPEYKLVLTYMLLYHNSVAYILINKIPCNKISMITFIKIIW